MNWTAINFDWNQIRGFLATVEEGSFSAAARATGTTQPTLSRQIAALEAALGVTLFERAGRVPQLTQAGLELVDHVRAMGEAAHRISLSASGQAQAVAGLVRVTASDIFSAWLLPPLVRDLHRQAPGIEVDIVAANDIRDLAHREADIAIRHVRPDQPDLIAKHLQDATARFYAAGSYVAAYGAPRGRDIQGHHFISFGDVDQMIGYISALGLTPRRDQFRAGSANGIVAWEMLRLGLGVAIMADAVAQLTPGVVPVLEDVPPVTFPIWLTTHRELHTSRKIRLVFDHLAAHFRA